MKAKSTLAFKLSVVVAAILTGAITLSGYVNSRICAHYSLESARAFLRFNSESIIKSIRQLMMSRNNQGIEELINEISRDSAVYGHVQLVSHHSGEVVASRYGGRDKLLRMEDRPCAVCHDQNVLDDAAVEIVDTVVDLPGGERALSVMAPILNESGCRSAACHAHQASPTILGFLNADYSLQRVDAMVTDRRILITVTVLTSLVLGIVALLFMFARLLDKPIKGLIAGTERIAARQLDFRFDIRRTDEIGVLEHSFNTMTATIQTHQDELRNAKEYLEGIVENSADIIITVNPEGLVQTFNRGAEQALGYGRDEVIGRRIESLFADSSERDVAIARMKSGDTVKNYATRFVAKDGQVRDVLLTLARLYGRKGDPIGTFGISKDITQEKQLQRELVKSQKFAAIGQAVTGIQHAIKNMLNALKGGVYVVRSGTAKRDRQLTEEGWAMLEEGIERIRDLSHNMLNYAKDWKPELQRVNLNDLVAKMCELNRQTAANRGVALLCEVADGLPGILCDPKLIDMAATNILVNAIDACAWKDYRTGENPEVVVTNYLAEGGDLFVIEVRDNGCGMNEEIRRNIFTPFFSIKKTQGTGLGLALTTRIINAHDGEISVESEPDRGAVFRIHLPIDGPRDTKEAVDGEAGSRS